MHAARWLYRTAVLLSIVVGLVLYAANDPVSGTLVIFAGLLLAIAVAAARAARSAMHGERRAGSGRASG
jgi:hypothetical protein